jgi:hypothetical protein
LVIESARDNEVDQPLKKKRAPVHKSAERLVNIKCYAIQNKYLNPVP